MNLYYYDNTHVVQPQQFSQQQEATAFGQLQQHFQPFSGSSQPQGHPRSRAYLPNAAYMSSGFGSSPKSTATSLSYAPATAHHDGATNSLVTGAAGATPITASPTTAYGQRPGNPTIGTPHYVTSGVFAGRTIRAELEEVQKADLGRKCADPPRPAPIQAHLGMQNIGSGPLSALDGRQRTARKDRRPLDPPPVVALRLYEVFNVGTDRQVERRIPVDEIDINGFIGHADLFPYKPSLNDPRVLKASLNFGNNISKAGYRRKQPPMHTGFPQPDLHDLSSRTQAPSDYDFIFSVPDSTSQSPSRGQGQDNTQVTDLLTQSQSPISLSFPSLSNTSAQNNLSDFPRLEPSEVREENKLTTSLFGTSYTHAVSMLDMQGEKTIYFVFSDLAVKLEGYFFLRYRFFDLSSILPPFILQAPVLAEAVGGVFAVYSTKEFPGLKASTELTKHLSRWGIRVNIRETERKRKPSAKGLANAMRGGRKRKSYDDQNEEESEIGSEYDDD